MDGGTDQVKEFFNQVWSFATDKHQEGVYNTVCLVVLLTLPLLVLLTTLAVCCHCCCCRHANSCCCKDAMATTRSETKKRKSSTEDLWISVKTRPMTPDRVALALV